MVIIGARFRDLSPVALGFIYGLVTGAGPTVIVMRAFDGDELARQIEQELDARRIAEEYGRENLVPPVTELVAGFLTATGSPHGVELCFGMPQRLASGGRLERCLEQVKRDLAGTEPSGPKEHV